MQRAHKTDLENGMICYIPIKTSGDIKDRNYKKNVEKVLNQQNKSSFNLK